MSVFRKAERQQAKFKGAITGPSGSGKTMGALYLAQGLGSKIALIDTENASASLYADRFEFDTLVINPPYSIDKYLRAIDAAIAEGYEVLVIDSISHAWASEGGVLDKKSKLDARGGNQFANWKEPKAEQGRLRDKIVNAPVHILCTMRSKQAYQVDEQTKKPLKLGLDPIQEPGMEYEFTTVLDVAMDHNAKASKDRTGLFDGQIFTITEKTGEAIAAWMNSAAPATERPTLPPVAPPVKPIAAAPSPRPPQHGPAPTPPIGKAQKTVTQPQIKRLFAILAKSDWQEKDVDFYIARRWALKSKNDLSMEQYDLICNLIMGGTAEKAFGDLDLAETSFDEPGAAG